MNTDHILDKIKSFDSTSVDDDTQILMYLSFALIIFIYRFRTVADDPSAYNDSISVSLNFPMLSPYLISLSLADLVVHGVLEFYDICDVVRDNASQIRFVERFLE